jgi:RNA polymerase sigma factor (sigma-70 family)
MWPDLNPSAQEPVPAHFSFSGPADEEPASQRTKNTNHERCWPKALLRRLHEGDCELFYDLTKAFLPNVYAFVRSMVDDASTADDICQQTFLIALQKVHQLRDIHCLRSWITQITVNQVRMVWRSTRRHPKMSIDVFADPDIRVLMPATLIDARETRLEALARKELSRILELALGNSLPGTARFSGYAMSNNSAGPKQLPCLASALIV